MISNLTVRKILLAMLTALFTWSCLIVAALGMMMLSILIIAGKAHLSVTLITASTTVLGPPSSTSALTKLTQGSTFIGLQFAMWVFIAGFIVCLGLSIGKIIIAIRKNKEKSNGC